MITSMRRCVACDDLWPWPISSRSFDLDFENRVRSVMFSVLDQLFCWLGIQYDPIMWVIMRLRGVSSERRRSSCSSSISSCCFIYIQSSKNILYVFLTCDIWEREAPLLGADIAGSWILLPFSTAFLRKKLLNAYVFSSHEKFILSPSSISGNSWLLFLPGKYFTVCHHVLWDVWLSFFNLNVIL